MIWGSGPSRPVYELTGGAVCLDFANTVDNRPTSHAKELIPDYRHLLAWCVQSEELSETDAAELLVRADQSPEECARALERARATREAIFSVFAAAARARPPSSESVRILNEALGRTLGRLQLQPANRSYRWRWQAAPLDLERPLWPVVRSASDLLASDELARVRECDAANCGWLFLDKSKNRTRRWCDMKVCGNRDKARRYRAARRPGERRGRTRRRGPRRQA